MKLLGKMREKHLFIFLIFCTCNKMSLLFDRPICPPRFSAENNEPRYAAHDGSGTYSFEEAYDIAHQLISRPDCWAISTGNDVHYNSREKPVVGDLFRKKCIEDKSTIPLFKDLSKELRVYIYEQDLPRSWCMVFTVFECTKNVEACSLCLCTDSVDILCQCE